MAADKKAYREEKLAPPVWDSDHQNYNDWRFCVELWNSVCDRAKISKIDKSYLLFAKLKDIKKNGLGAKLVTAAQLGEIDVFSDTGVDDILKVLDGRFKEDQLALKKKAWHAFIKTKRSQGEEIDSYIDNFEENVTNLRKLGRDLDDETLALQLMENASLSDEISQLVLSGINEKSNNIFDQAKKSMRKYMGSDKTGLSVNKGGTTIKEEAFHTSGEPGNEFTDYEDEEEVMYTNNKGRRNNYRGRSVPRGRGRGRGNQQRGTPIRSSAQSRARYNNNARQRGGAVKRQTNPLDEDGYPMTCNICGSIFHFSGRNGAGCPESYENIQIKEKAEDVNKCEIPIEEVYHMRSTEDALLDSCCSANVMGNNRISNN